MSQYHLQYFTVPHWFQAEPVGTRRIHAELNNSDSRQFQVDPGGKQIPTGSRWIPGGSRWNLRINSNKSSFKKT